MRSWTRLARAPTVWCCYSRAPAAHERSRNKGRSLSLSDKKESRGDSQSSNVVRPQVNTAAERPARAWLPVRWAHRTFESYRVTLRVFHEVARRRIPVTSKPVLFHPPQTVHWQSCHPCASSLLRAKPHNETQRRKSFPATSP